MLTSATRSRLQLRQINITVFTNDTNCFGDGVFQSVLGVWVGFDVAFLNHFLRAFDCSGTPGYCLDFTFLIQSLGFIATLSGEFYNLYSQQEMQDLARGGVDELMVYKVSLLLAALIVSATTTWCVSLVNRTAHLKVFEFASTPVKLIKQEES